MYRDPVRSSHSHFVKAKGLRRVSLMLLAKVSWARRVWALPFLTVLAPSRHYHEARGRRHKTITDWARQMLCRLRRWLPDRELVVVADRTYATLKLLAACQATTPPVTFLTRLRLDAVLHDPPPPRKPGQRERPRIVGARQPSLQAVLADPATVWIPLRQRWPDGTKRRLLVATGTALWYHPGEPTVSLRWLLLRDPTGRREPQALLCTDPDWTPTAILTAYLQRWQVEVTFQEMRAHLGVETQRQGSAAAIARTTPVLLGLSAGSFWSPTTCAGSVPCAPAGPPGTPRPSPPSPTSWLVSATPSLDPAAAFFPVPGHPRHPKTPPAAARTAAGRPLLLGLTRARPLGARTDFVQSRAQAATGMPCRVVGVGHGGQGTGPATVGECPYPRWLGRLPVSRRAGIDCFDGMQHRVPVVTGGLAPNQRT